jgi:hypothetical protein
MERYTPEAQEETMSERLQEFIHELSEMTGEQLPVEYIDGTYQIEAENFTLTFTCEDKIFEIRSIDVRGNQGLVIRLFLLYTIMQTSTGLKSSPATCKIQHEDFGENGLPRRRDRG